MAVHGLLGTVYQPSNDWLRIRVDFVKRRSLKNISKTRIAVAAFLSVILSLSVVAPAAAARIYNPDTNVWEDATAVKARTKRGSAIARTVVNYETKFKPVS
jgi:hypothetical protein